MQSVCEKILTQMLTCAKKCVIYGKLIIREMSEISDSYLADKKLKTLYKSIFTHGKYVQQSVP